jgi:hypothetical protein
LGFHQFKKNYFYANQPELGLYLEQFVHFEILTLAKSVLNIHVSEHFWLPNKMLESVEIVAKILNRTFYAQLLNLSFFD